MCLFEAGQVRIRKLDVDTIGRAELGGVLAEPGGLFSATYGVFDVGPDILEVLPGTGNIQSISNYNDFILHAEFRIPSPPDSGNGNSGIFLRCANPKAAGADTCYEVNVFDTRPDPSYGTGGIVDVAKVTTPIKTGGKWNTYEIRAQGSHLVVTLNGTKTVDVQDAKHARGPFALQWGAGVVKFRSVQIRPL